MTRCPKTLRAVSREMLKEANALLTGRGRFDPEGCALERYGNLYLKQAQAIEKKAKKR